MAAVQPTSTPATTSGDHPTTPISICNCGCAFATQVYTTRNNTEYGPAHDGHLKLRNAPEFLFALQQGRVTQEEFDIISAMSLNEGNVEAVQSWDSEVVTAGAMQKTIKTPSPNHPNDTGELTAQIIKFKSQNPTAFNELFSHCGWNIQGSGASARISYTHPSLTNGNAVTDNDLKDAIRDGFNEQAYTAHHSPQHTPYPPNIPFGSLIQAISDTRFVTLQVNDFIDRLHTVLSIVVPHTGGLTVGDIFHTKLGRATALDQHVNRPFFVAHDISVALQQVNISVANWSTEPNIRKTTELSVVNYYGVHRRMNPGVNVPRFHMLEAHITD